jgi:hypothetical protein
MGKIVASLPLPLGLVNSDFWSALLAETSESIKSATKGPESGDHLGGVTVSMRRRFKSNEKRRTILFDDVAVSLCLAGGKELSVLQRSSLEYGDKVIAEVSKTSYICNHTTRLVVNRYTSRKEVGAME